MANRRICPIRIINDTPMKIAIITLAAFMFIFTGCSLDKTVNEDTNQTTNVESTMVSNIPSEHTEEITNGNAVEDVLIETERDDQKENKDREEWKNYIDDMYGFSFSYPPEWTLSSEEHYLDSKVIVGEKIRAVNLFSGERKVLSVYPEGEFDHGTPGEAQQTEVEIDEQVATKIFGEGFVIYYFTNIPVGIDTSFRIEAFPTTDEEDDEVTRVVQSMDFNR